MALEQLKSVKHYKSQVITMFPETGKMKGEAHEYRLSVDYCAFMVAILLARHEVNRENSEKQWSGAEMSEKLNNLPYSSTADFYVDSEALQHGLSIFQKQLNKRGLIAVPVAYNREHLRDFFDLVAAQRLIQIKFLGYNESPEGESECDLLSRILAIRNDLLCKSNYAPSSNPTPSSVLGHLYHPMIISQRYPKGEKKIVLKIEEKKITRKSPSKLKKRAIKNNTLRLLDSVKRKFGFNNVQYYLESAVKMESVKKQKLINSGEYIEDENKNDDSNLEDGNDEDLALNEIENDDEVVDKVSKLKGKYIIFGDEDQNSVVALFEVVRDVARNREYVKFEKIAAKITAKILSEINYYSTIKARTILRWYSVKDKVDKKSGPKIIENFESEIWGNLMLCIFEKEQEEVRFYYHFSIKNISKYKTLIVLFLSCYIECGKKKGSRSSKCDIFLFNS